MIKMIQIIWNSQPQKAVNPTGSPTSPVFNSNSMKCSMKLHLYATIFDASNENQASSNCFFSPAFLKNSKLFNKHAKNRLIQSSIILILTWRCQTVSIQKKSTQQAKDGNDSSMTAVERGGRCGRCSGWLLTFPVSNQPLIAQRFARQEFGSKWCLFNFDTLESVKYKTLPPPT